MRLKDALYLSVCRSEVDQSQTPAVWITRCLRARHISLRKKREKKKAMFIYLFTLSLFPSPVERVPFGTYNKEVTHQLLNRSTFYLNTETLLYSLNLKCRGILIG